ncbi:hypothetical protein BHE74_00004724 [Ensete ventricosum]|nr:hypothetical protein BHE74_00004724 [Ensete ventricosum]RZR76895.1 hypothetical protein BHM03_00001795 [Ensete ventricosum]
MMMVVITIMLKANVVDLQWGRQEPSPTIKAGLFPPDLSGHRSRKRLLLTHPRFTGFAMPKATTTLLILVIVLLRTSAAAAAAAAAERRSSCSQQQEDGESIRDDASQVRWLNEDGGIALDNNQISHLIQ